MRPQPPESVLSSAPVSNGVFLSCALHHSKNCAWFVVSCWIVLFASTGSVSADVLDTLSVFNKHSTYRWYRVAGLQVQAARFEPKAAGEIKQVQLLLAGNSSDGTARLRIFGYEGGGTAPFLQQDLIDPIIVRKSRSGLESITVQLSQPVKIDHRQFFIALDQLSDDLALVTDSEPKPVCCEDASESFRYQSLQTSDGRWWTGNHGFAVDVIMSYSQEPTLQWLADMTLAGGIVDTSSVAGGISWADFNSDGFVDLLLNGRLYRNIEGVFTDVTREAGLRGTPASGLFIDVNNDTRPDILFLGSADTTTEGASTLFLAQAGGGFQEHSLSLPPITHPTSFSIADADLDGYLDLFVGQGRDEHGKPLPNFLLINNRKGDFVNRSEKLYPENDDYRASQGSQWVDIDDDGFLDLYVVNQGKDGAELWRGNGDGTFSIVFSPDAPGFEPLYSVNSLGGHWQDADGDLSPDLLAPQYSTLEHLSGDVAAIRTVTLNEKMRGINDRTTDSYLGLQYVEKQGSGMWVDVDNNGALDIFLASASPCRNANLYLAASGNHYEARSSEFGLLHIPAGPDGVWLDYDNDGKLDLATLVNGRFHLFRNTIEGAGNYVQVDIAGADMTGLKVDLYAGEQIISREVASGRGLLMQDPLRLHFGIGDKTTVDSLRVRWPGGGTQVFTDVAINRLNRLLPQASASANGAVLADVRAFPNPFSDNLTIGFELKSKTMVSIRIYDLQGNVVVDLQEGVLDAGVHNIQWQAVAENGKPIAQGTYIYRVLAGDDTFNGRVVLGR